MGHVPRNLPTLLMIGFEELRIISWNVRGAVHEYGKLFIKELIRSKKPDIVLLYEIRCQFAQVSHYWNSLGFFPAFVSEAIGFSGGIWVMIRTNFGLSTRLIHMHGQAITFELWKDNLSWVCNAIYASPIPEQREILWQHLTQLRESISIPWLLVGDMNEVLQPSEVRGGDFIPSRAHRFASVLDKCRLIDLGLVGGNYMWFRNRNNIIILSKRLDRALGDVDWRLAFPEASVEILTRVHSYHSPLLVHCGGQEHSTVLQRPFRFAWINWIGCVLLQ
ncbi:uncharacterized protein LOC130745123 [Lotus japonicus]|uniref:uncharacterized protein LOC130745123 n=1 Tax=Lotus japonicus TaxID=34305 RepID=UPI00258B6307|nr:uncharacterized protein LOC130745123 [Lotus japonicus]